MPQLNTANCHHFRCSPVISLHCRLIWAQFSSHTSLWTDSQVGRFWAERKLCEQGERSAVWGPPLGARFLSSPRLQIEKFWTFFSTSSWVFLKKCKKLIHSLFYFEKNQFLFSFRCSTNNFMLEKKRQKKKGFTRVSKPLHVMFYRWMGLWIINEVLNFL